ncbi:FGGY-family carbohydrate kinase [Acerihabitans sp. KWT182]|uniref:FGGY-family carbohydrate kinase n=1 Tax=Acerihabitans sp. KWT182 TaxID=3157919 RepID=A0AAU7Q8V8_9GAMM
MDYVIGVDIGTQSTKAIVLRLDGKIAGQASAGYEVDRPEPLWAEQWPTVWSKAVYRTIVESVRASGATAQEIRGICVSSLYGGAGIPVNKEMRPLYPCLIWMDRRAADIVSWVNQHVDTEKLFRITGNGLDSYYGYTKMLWIKRHCPDVWREIHQFLPPNTYINYLLTGHVAVDHCSAGNIGGVYDMNARRWSDAALDMLGIPRRFMPDRLVDSSAVVGGLLPSAADELGLLPETPVMAGGVDAAVATLAAGVMAPGDHVAMIGTSMCWGYINPEVDAANRLVSMPYVINSRRDNYIFGGAGTAGAAVSWFRDTFCQSEVRAAAQTPGVDAHDLLERQAHGVDAGSGGVLFLPYLMGERSPLWDPYASGAFLGMSLTHTKGHLYRAVLEGIAFALRDNMECGRKGAVWLEPRLIVVGGGARSDLWMQIIADVTGYPVVTMQEEVEAPLGDAVLAALGAGLIHDAAIVRSWSRLEERARPDASRHAHYDLLFKQYQEVYLNLKENMCRLKTLADENYIANQPDLAEEQH